VDTQFMNNSSNSSYERRRVSGTKKYAPTMKKIMNPPKTKPILALRFPYPGLNMYGATNDHIVLTALEMIREMASVFVRRTDVGTSLAMA
jgi:hypothetical protein